VPLNIAHIFTFLAAVTGRQQFRRASAVVPEGLSLSYLHRVLVDDTYISFFIFLIHFYFIVCSSSCFLFYLLFFLFCILPNPLQALSDEKQEDCVGAETVCVPVAFTGCVRLQIRYVGCFIFRNISHSYFPNAGLLFTVSWLVTWYFTT